jgi:polyisoprenoid-binding protein YceI
MNEAGNSPGPNLERPMTTYRIDPSHSSAGFTIKHMMIAKVHGGFEKMSGTFVYDPANLAKSSVDVTIETASVNTREAQRDTHLRSPDFFDVEKYPSIAFKSTRFEDAGDDLRIVGDLTIHGVTKPVVLDVERPSEETKDPWGNVRIGASAKTKVKRKDFGLTWNAALEAGGLLVGDDVNIALDVQFVKQA